MTTKKTLTPMNRYRVLFRDFKLFCKEFGMEYNELTGTNEVVRRLDNKGTGWSYLTNGEIVPEIDSIEQLMSSPIVQRGVKSDYLMLIKNKTFEYSVGIEVRYKGEFEQNPEFRATIKNNSIVENTLGNPNVVGSDYVCFLQGTKGLKQFCEMAQSVQLKNPQAFIQVFCIAFFNNADVRSLFNQLQQQRIDEVRSELQTLSQFSEKVSQSALDTDVANKAFYDEFYATPEYAEYKRCKEILDKANAALAVVKDRLMAKHQTSYKAKTMRESKDNFEIKAFEITKQLLNKR